MNRTFKSLTDRKAIDLIPYIKAYLEQHPGTEIYIGCDSQNDGARTSYATVIVLHNTGRGGHVLFSKDEVPRVRRTTKSEVEFVRLWAEVERSVEVAEFLKDNGIQKPKAIDIDLNPDPQFQSNAVLRSALGYVESLGYTPRCKPDAVSATYVADKICK